MQTDRETDRQTDRQAGRQPYRQIDRQTDQAGRCVLRQIEKQAGMTACMTACMPAGHIECANLNHGLSSTVPILANTSPIRRQLDHHIICVPAFTIQRCSPVLQLLCCLGYGGSRAIGRQECQAQDDDAIQEQDVSKVDSNSNPTPPVLCGHVQAQKYAVAQGTT